MITKADVRYVANLARIHLRDDELEHLSKQLEDILNYIHKLNQLDTKEVEPMSHVLHLQNVFRDDEVRPSLPVSDVLGIARFKHKNLFKVPKVIE
jgi:aspartyl-tRNA(Asn)/glutamyl-tRNA(Gln) amidotransferase subunit C